MLSDDTNEFGIKPNSMTIGTNYTVTVIITDTPTGNRVWKGQQYVMVKQKKYSSRVTINPY